MTKHADRALAERIGDGTKEASACPVCACIEHVPFFDLAEVPVEEGILFDTRESARSCPVGEIRLSYCPACGHIWNRAYRSGLVRFDERYDISMHYSKLYGKFIDALASRLVSAYGLYHKTILEIGCGKGEFLRQLVRIGRNRGIGFDPSYAGGAECEERDEAVSFVAEHFTGQHVGADADFICCRHVLDDLENPLGFVSLVAKVSESDKPIVMYFEVPNGLYTFRDVNVWNIAYANYSYFTPRSLASLFSRCQMEVLSVAPCFEDDQYLGIEARLDPRQQGAFAWSVENESHIILEQLRTFSSVYHRKLMAWQEELETLARTGQKVIAWGGGVRAISFLSRLRIKEQIEYVVDINPNKQGKFLPLTGQEVVGPEFVRDYRPDVVFITNNTFTAEIRQQVAEMGVSCQFKELV